MDKNSCALNGANLGRKGLALIIALMLSAFMILPACSPNKTSGESSSQDISQANAIEVTVNLAANEDVNFAAQSATVEIEEGGTVYDALKVSGFDIVASDSQYGKYVESIEGLAGENSSGWVYTVNGETVMDACDAKELAAGDIVEWSYVTW